MPSPLGEVHEIVQPYNTDTYRAVYVLHCFQKKSKSGKSTPPKDINLIEQRLKLAKVHDAGQEDQDNG